jgi:hypothetical protein
VAPAVHSTHEPEASAFPIPRIGLVLAHFHELLGIRCVDSFEMDRRDHSLSLSNFEQ